VKFYSDGRREGNSLELNEPAGCVTELVNVANPAITLLFSVELATTGTGA